MDVCTAICQFVVPPAKMCTPSGKGTCQLPRDLQAIRHPIRPIPPPIPPPSPPFHTQPSSHPQCGRLIEILQSCNTVHISPPIPPSTYQCPLQPARNTTWLSAMDPPPLLAASSKLKETGTTTREGGGRGIYVYNIALRREDLFDV